MTFVQFSANSVQGEAALGSVEDQRRQRSRLQGQPTHSCAVLPWVRFPLHGVTFLLLRPAPPVYCVAFQRAESLFTAFKSRLEGEVSCTGSGAGSSGISHTWDNLHFQNRWSLWFTTASALCAASPHLLIYIQAVILSIMSLENSQ